jgi:hypothetical protein
MHHPTNLQFTSVVNHADIDFTEEPSSSLSKPGSFVFSGSCDIISTLLKIESLPIHMENERQLTSYMNRVEVLGRSGSLPVAYAEAAANHMLGLLLSSLRSFGRQLYEPLPYFYYRRLLPLW